MSFTQAELDALKEAYAAGALRVTHEGKTVEYGSESDLLRRIRVVEKDLAQSSGRARHGTVYCSFSRG
ncbi:MAG: hypothetical protein HQL80_06595 [Magnetococcales bacterium]|nr:hypothetical protein [Magnetococcales bacterium]MBF0583892.1 hypothetical protein [Magnetococcales bacterium]